MTDSLDTANRVEGSKVNAVARVLDEIAPLATPRRPRPPRMIDVEDFYLPDGTGISVQTDGARVDLTLGMENADSITAYLDDQQTIQLAEVLLRSLGMGIDANEHAPREVRQARNKLASYLDDQNQHGYGSEW